MKGLKSKGKRSVLNRPGRIILAIVLVVGGLLIVGLPKLFDPSAPPEIPLAVQLVTIAPETRSRSVQCIGILRWCDANSKARRGWPAARSSCVTSRYGRLFSGSATAPT